MKSSKCIEASSEPLDISSRRTLRSSTLTSSPREVLLVMLHNCRTQKELALSSIRKSGDSGPLGPGSRSMLDSLNRSIFQCERALEQLDQDTDPVVIFTYEKEAGRNGNLS